MVVSLEDVLNRYTPPVPSDMYQVCYFSLDQRLLLSHWQISFAPVLTKEEVENEHKIQWSPQPVNKR